MFRRIFVVALVVATAASSVILAIDAREQARTAASPAGRLSIDKLIDIEHPSAPVWSRDSQRVAFVSERAGVANLYVVPADGSAKPSAITVDGGGAGGVFWSADSRRVFFMPATDRRRLAGLWTLVSLLYLTRPDAVLLVLPMVLFASYQARNLRRIAVAIGIGAMPALLWTAFATIYYGFPFPNTAYAKLATGVSGGELRRQGWLYLLDSLDRDPITLVTIAFAIVIGVATRHSAARALAAGIAWYLGYVVWIGGDFMSPSRVMVRRSLKLAAS